MCDYLFILGAGASHDCGAPLMNEFLDRSEDILRKADLFEFRDMFQLVFDARANLQWMQAKSEFNIHNIESVFAAFEFGKIIQKIPNMKQKKHEKLVESMRSLISVTLEKSIRFPVRNEKTITPTKTYSEFAKVLKEAEENGLQTAVITFNYDFALDFALQDRGFEIDYGMDRSPRSHAIKLLKMHGSLNWGKCRKCGSIVSQDVAAYMKSVKVQPGKEFFRSNMYSALNSQIHCGQRGLTAPSIIPPIWNKTLFNREMAPVWIQAARALEEAENIFVIGYSLQETDYFFTYLYSLGSAGHSTIKNFYIIDPNIDEVTSRFSNLLSSAVKKRLYTVKSDFYTAMDRIRSLMKILYVKKKKHDYE